MSRLSGFNQKSLSRLQIVQIAVPTLLNRHHITPIHVSLSVRFKVDFKILLITFKAHRGLAPIYIAETLTPYKPVCSLRSSDGAFLAVPKSRLKSKGDCFCHRSPSASEWPVWGDNACVTGLRLRTRKQIQIPVKQEKILDRRQVQLCSAESLFAQYILLFLHFAFLHLASTQNQKQTKQNTLAS